MHNRLKQYIYTENEFEFRGLEIGKERIKFIYETDYANPYYKNLTDSATKIKYLSIGERKIQYILKDAKLYLTEPLPGSARYGEEPFYYLIETTLG